MTAAGKTYEEIAQMVAEQVIQCNITAIPKITTISALSVGIAVTFHCKGDN